MPRRLLTGTVVAFALLWPEATAAEDERARSEDPLVALGFAVTGGAAPGYVDDRACEICHGRIWDSYRDVAMARSFIAAEAANAVEDFPEEPFHHVLSGRFYRMELKDGRYLFRRWTLDATGQRRHEIEIPVDWILGSGHHSRTYLYRTASGELYQLPLAWYAQDRRWAMAPGYDGARHFGLQRKVRRECMSCHNAYPDVPAGSDAYGRPHVFPEELPEGIGCQRCHGPGAQHARAALTGELEELTSTIVHPGRLEPARRDDICFGCHLQPSVMIPGLRRFARGDYSFRPGQVLADFQVQVDIVEADRRQDERFEINHHPYRLFQSACPENAFR